MDKEIKFVRQTERNQQYETRNYYNSILFTESISLVRTESSGCGQQHKISVIVDYCLDLR